MAVVIPGAKKLLPKLPPVDVIPDWDGEPMRGAGTSLLNLAPHPVNALRTGRGRIDNGFDLAIP